MTKAIARKLLSNSVPEPNTGCLLWLGGVNSEGYGRICHNGKTFYAHRTAWEIEHGASAHGKFVCHHCDTPACINPDHLFLGTAAENNFDMLVKGRASGGKLRGEQNPASRLSAGDVARIRASIEPRRVLAERFGVSLRTIFHIRSGDTWLGLTEAA